MPIDPLQVSCKYCRSTDLYSFLAQERMLGMGNKFTYQECRNCGSLQLAQIPENLGDFYPAAYYSFQSLRKSDAKRRLMKRARMILYRRTGWFKPIYGYWLRKLKLRFSDRIADVGCGNGQLLYELYAGGFKSLEGYDPYISESSHPEKGLSIYKKELAQADGKFDCIMLHHAFEHLEDPERALISYFEKLNPGGKLLVRCPVSDAEIWKQKRELWVQLDGPRHLTIPSVKGFVGLAQKSGFKIEEILFDSDAFQFWGTGLYEKGEKLDQSKISTFYSREDYREMQKKALQYNQEGKGDQACFFLRKPLKA